MRPCIAYNTVVIEVSARATVTKHALLLLQAFSDVLTLDWQFDRTNTTLKIMINGNSKTYYAQKKSNANVKIVRSMQTFKWGYM